MCPWRRQGVPGRWCWQPAPPEAASPLGTPGCGECAARQGARVPRRTSGPRVTSGCTRFWPGLHGFAEMAGSVRQISTAPAKLGRGRPQPGRGARGRRISRRPSWSRPHGDYPRPGRDGLRTGMAGNGVAAGRHIRASSSSTCSRESSEMPVSLVMSSRLNHRTACAGMPAGLGAAGDRREDVVHVCVP